MSRSFAKPEGEVLGVEGIAITKAVEALFQAARVLSALFGDAKHKYLITLHNLSRRCEGGNNGESRTSVCSCAPDVV